MTRFPLRITKQELPPKPEPWTKELGQALFLFGLYLLWVYVIIPVLSGN